MNTLGRSFRTHLIISVGPHYLLLSAPTSTTLSPTFSEMTTPGPWAPLVFTWGSYLHFYPTPGRAPFLMTTPIVFLVGSHTLATLLPSALRHVFGALCFGTPLRALLLRRVDRTLVCVDWTLLCLHTFDTFVLRSQSFTLFTISLFLFFTTFFFMSGRGRALRVCQSDWLAELLIGWICLVGLLLAWMYTCLFICLSIPRQRGSSLPELYYIAKLAVL